mmetsp:Transcript_6030/g.8363  ORF Transcript_6030/g.8363 Transcript_6030/m.8363 type:complete len:699 (-) Transcript_6030:120-2216(-)
MMKGFTMFRWCLLLSSFMDAAGESNPMKFDPEILPGSFIERYSSCSRVDEKAICGPRDFSKVLVMDSTNKTARLLPDEYTGNAQYRACAYAGSIEAAGSVRKKVYCAPFEAQGVLAIDSISETSRVLSGYQDATLGKYDTCLAIERTGKIYCPPWNAQKILVIDTNTENVYEMNETYTGASKYTACTVNGDKIYCAPYNGTAALVINTSNDTSQLVGQISSSEVGLYKTCVSASVQTNESDTVETTFCFPYKAQKILRIEPTNAIELEAASTLDGAEDMTSFYGKYTSCAVSLDSEGQKTSKIYCAPGPSVDFVLLFDALTEKGVQLRGMQYFNDFATCTAIPGRILCPYDNGNPKVFHNILEIDTLRNISYELVNNLNFTFGSYRACTAFAENIYCAPFYESHPLLIDVSPTPAPTSSPTLDPMVELEMTISFPDLEFNSLSEQSRKYLQSEVVRALYSAKIEAGAVEHPEDCLVQADAFQLGVPGAPVTGGAKSKEECALACEGTESFACRYWKYDAAMDSCERYSDPGTALTGVVWPIPGVYDNPRSTIYSGTVTGNQCSNSTGVFVQSMRAGENGEVELKVLALCPDEDVRARYVEILASDTRAVFKSENNLQNSEFGVPGILFNGYPGFVSEDNSSDTSSSEHNSSVATILIVVCVVCVSTLLIVGALVYICRRHKKTADAKRKGNVSIRMTV